MDTGWQSLASGVPNIKISMIGYWVEVTVQVPSSYTLPGGIGLIEASAGWRIPAAYRPSAEVYRGAPACGSAVMDTASSGMVPTQLQIDAAGAFRYITTPGDKKGLTGTVVYRAGGV